MNILIPGVILIVAILVLFLFTDIGEILLYPVLDKLGFFLERKYGLKHKIVNPVNPLKKYVGHVGYSITELIPSGKILVDNERCDAISVKGIIKKDVKVVVRNVRGNTLKVEEI